MFTNTSHPTFAMNTTNLPPSEPSTPSAPALSALDSADLLQGQKSVHIVHNGQSYRLQATKLGKLILTK